MSLLHFVLFNLHKIQYHCDMLTDNIEHFTRIDLPLIIFG